MTREEKLKCLELAIKTNEGIEQVLKLNSKRLTMVAQEFYNWIIRKEKKVKT